MAAKTKPKEKAPKKPRKSRALVELRPYRSTGGGFLPGLMPSHAEHESPIERALLIHLILCIDVTQIESQTPTISYTRPDGSVASYTPDFTVIADGRPVTLEAKALTYLLEAESIIKYATIARHYLLTKAPYHFVVDAQLEEMPRAGNARLLFRYATCPIADGARQNASFQLADGPKTIRQLCSDARLELIDVYTLIATKHLCIDWNKPVGIDAEVSLPGQPYGGLRLEHILCSTRFGCLLEELALGRRPSDQRQLALAKVWRQRVYSLSPFNFVGGLPGGIAFLDSAESESGAGGDEWTSDRAVSGQPAADDLPRAGRI